MGGAGGDSGQHDAAVLSLCVGRNIPGRSRGVCETTFSLPLYPPPFQPFFPKYYRIIIINI